MSSYLRVYHVGRSGSADHPHRAPAVLTWTPDPRLREYVSGYLGFTERARLPAVQRALPSTGVPLLLGFARYRGVLSANGVEFTMPAFPVGGLHDHPVVLRQAVAPYGVAVVLTPPGAYALFGIPLREITNTYADLTDLLGQRAVSLADQLASAPSWPARFALLNRTLSAWLTPDARQPAAAIRRAWQRLELTHGQLRISTLATELEVSRSYLDKRFGEQIGLPPKVVARVLRFRHTAELLTSVGPTTPLSRIANACGYSDQAHLDREFRSLADCTPTEFLRSPGLDSRGDGEDPGGPGEVGPRR